MFVRLVCCYAVIAATIVLYVLAGFVAVLHSDAERRRDALRVMKQLPWIAAGMITVLEYLRNAAS
jgi:hypothetical protein